MTEFNEDNIRPIDRVSNISRMLFFLFIFLLGIKGLGNGFSLLGGDLLDNIFQVTANPFLGLIVGVLTTSMVQSSSVTTSLIVGLVAAPVNPLPIANAIPMIMGANFGTSITTTARCSHSTDILCAREKNNAQPFLTLERSAP